MDSLPPELILHIATVASTSDIEIYRALLAIPAFARYTISEARNHIIAQFLTTVTVFDDKCIQITEHYFNGELHYVEQSNGRKKWYKYGELHRDNGPAIIEPDGTKKWYQQGYLHRDSLPAIEYANGGREWFCWNSKYSSTTIVL